MTGVGVVTLLVGEEDQLAGVLGEPDAVGVLVESLLAGVLVAVHLGLAGVPGKPDAVEQGSRGMLRCRSGMASRIGKRSTGHRENVLGAVWILCVLLGTSGYCWVLL